MTFYLFDFDLGHNLDTQTYPDIVTIHLHTIKFIVSTVQNIWPVRQTKRHTQRYD